MLPDSTLPWPLPKAAVALIAEREGCRLRAYKCPAGVWTIGWGETAGVQPGMVWTQAQADQRLCDELVALKVQVLAVLKAHAEPNQLGALCSLAYNIGTGAFAKSSVLRAHNGGDVQAAARAFALWNKATVGGVLTVLPGLTARRAAEAALYLTPEPDEPLERMPQAVEAESSVAASPIAISGVATTTAGVLAAATQAGDSIGAAGKAVKQVRDFVVDGVGLPAGSFLPIVLIVAGFVAVYYRVLQRRGGWA